MTTRKRARVALPAAPPNTATLYVRLSREAKAENLSLPGMVADVQARAAALGCHVVALHVDDGLSGAIRNRPEFVGWLDDIREHRAAVAVTFHVDRLTREGVNVAALILDAIEGKDPETGAVVRQPARLTDCKGLDSAGDETAFRFSFVIKAEVARGERERMADRSRDAQERLRAAGRWTGGAAPFGFVRVPAPDGLGVVLSPGDSEATFLREAGERILAGATLPAVTRWANGPYGHKPRRAASWSKVALRQMLTHTPSAITEDIVSADTRAALRQALLSTEVAKSRGRYPARLLSGLLRCSSCDRRLAVSQSGKKNVFAYQCPADPGACERRVSVKAEWVDDHVEDRFLREHGDDPEYARRAIVSGAAAVEAAHEAENAALAALKVSATPEALHALQAAQAARVDAEAAPQETEVRLVPTGRTVAEVWEALETADKRDMLTRHYAALILLPGTHRRTGFDPARLVVLGNVSHSLAGSDPASYRFGGPTSE